METLKNKKTISIIIAIAAIIGLGYFMFANAAKISSITTPFVIGIIIAYLLNPLVKMLERRKVPRGIAILLIGLVFMILAAALLSYLIPTLYSNIADLVANIPTYAKDYNNMLNWFQTKMNVSTLPTQVKEIIISQAKGNIAYFEGLFISILKNSLGAISSTFGFLMNFLLGIFIGYYLLKDLSYFKMKVSGLIPRKWRNVVNTTANEMNVIVSNYVQGQLIILAIVAVLETIGLWIVGVKYSLVLGLVGGIANVIPYFGPFIGAVPAVAIALLDSPTRALLALVVFLIVQQIDNSIISPRIMSQSIGLHPITIIFVILVFGTFFGMAGLIVCIPLTAILKLIGKKIYEKIV